MEEKKKTSRPLYFRRISIPSLFPKETHTFTSRQLCRQGSKRRAPARSRRQIRYRENTHAYVRSCNGGAHYRDCLPLLVRTYEVPSARSPINQPISSTVLHSATVASGHPHTHKLLDRGRRHTYSKQSLSLSRSLAPQFPFPLFRGRKSPNPPPPPSPSHPKKVNGRLFLLSGSLSGPGLGGLAPTCHQSSGKGGRRGTLFCHSATSSSVGPRKRGEFDTTTHIFRPNVTRRGGTQKS